MNEEILLNTLLSPHISEKVTTVKGSKVQYAFEVNRKADKKQIERAIKYLFKVEVESVRVCNVRGKVVRRGTTQGRRDAWKKAYVTLKEGHDITLGSET